MFESIGNEPATSSSLHMSACRISRLALTSHFQDVGPLATTCMLVEAACRLRITCIEELAHGSLFAARTTALELVAVPASMDSDRGHGVEECIDQRCPFP